jgi:hypothetical protein
MRFMNTYNKSNYNPSVIKKCELCPRSSKRFVSNSDGSVTICLKCFGEFMKKKDTLLIGENSPILKERKKCPYCVDDPNDSRLEKSLFHHLKSSHRTKDTKKKVTFLEPVNNSIKGSDILVNNDHVDWDSVQKEPEKKKSNKFRCFPIKFPKSLKHFSTASQKPQD